MLLEPRTRIDRHDTRISGTSLRSALASADPTASSAAWTCIPCPARRRLRPHVGTHVCVEAGVACCPRFPCHTCFAVSGSFMDSRTRSRQEKRIFLHRTHSTSRASMNHLLVNVSPFPVFSGLWYLMLMMLSSSLIKDHCNRNAVSYVQ